MSNQEEHAKKNEGQGHVKVSFTYLNTNEEVDFLAGASDTLLTAWNVAYDKLEEAKKPDDKLECESGADLMSQLNLTLGALHAQGVCVNRKFQIRCSTGGA